MAYDLNLRVGGAAWRHYAERLADPGFEQFSKSVFERDQNSCVYCSFSASCGMCVVNVDHDYTNNRMSNLVTTCPFCQQCCFLEAVGSLQAGGGMLIYLPEISQGQLNALCHVFYASIVNGSSHAKVADHYIQSLKLRSSMVEKHYGKGMSNPAFMGQMFLDTPSSDLARKQASILSNVRLLPALDKFEKEITMWAQNAFVSA
jgi:intracellular multiplication protein IcmJ